MSQILFLSYLIQKAVLVFKCPSRHTKDFKCQTLECQTSILISLLTILLSALQPQWNVSVFAGFQRPCFPDAGP